MSRLRFNIVFLLGLFASYNSFSQKPVECTTPPAGYKLGSSFQLSNRNLCTNPVNSMSGTLTLTHSAAPTLTDVNFIFDFKNAAQLTNASSLIRADLTTKSADVNVINQPFGTYWIAQIGKDASGDKYLTCDAVTVIPEVQPKIIVERCKNNVVRVRFPADVNNFYTKYRINWNDATPETEVGVAPSITPDHTYILPPVGGKLSIQGTYNANGALCVSKYFDYDVLPGAAPYISLVHSINSGASAKLEFKEFETDKGYDIEYRKQGETSWTAWGNQFKNGTAQINNLDTKSSYCFRIKTQDPCGNTIYSTHEACSIRLETKITAKNTVKLDWNHPINSGISRYNITRETIGVAGSKIGPFNPTPSGSNTHTDIEGNGLKCGNRYIYNVSTDYLASSKNVKIISADIEADLRQTTTLPKPNIVGVASVIDRNSKIQVNIQDLNPIASPIYNFHRSENGGDYKLTSTENKNLFTDIDVKPSNNYYCYKIQIGDDCNNLSEFSVPFCSILLKANNSSTLKWTEYIDEPSIKQYVNYNIAETDENGGNPQTFEFNLKDLNKEIDYSKLRGDKQESYFMITGIYTPPSVFGGIPQNSNFVRVVLPPKIYAPTAFTPNGDGDNDVFDIKDKFIEEYKITMFDRWGKPFYEAANQGWSGRDQEESTNMPPGYYAFKIDAKDQVGQKVIKTGSVLLIR
jgi:gliding motility-associated-like protein